jgi:type I restriction enzyme, S subunit
MSELKPGWRRVRFGDVVRLVSDRCDPLNSGIERFVGLEHIQPGDLRIRSWGYVADGTTFTSRFRPGQVLFGKRRAYQRKVAVADFEGVCSGDIYVFEADDSRVLLPELLPFVCQTDGFFEHAVGTSAGSLSPRTNWTSIASYKFTLPPLGEQRRLVQLLVAGRAAAEAVTQAIVMAKQTTEAFVDNALKRMLAEYPTYSAPELLKRLTVGIVVKPADLYTEAVEGVPALRSLNIAPGRLITRDLVRITANGHAMHAKSSLHPGDVVVVRTGRPGDAAVIPQGTGPLNCIDLIVTTPRPEIRSEFLCHVLNSAFGRRQISSGAAGTAQQHFNVGAFKRLRLPCPPLVHQDELVKTVHELSTATRSLENRMASAQSLHQTLLKEVSH